MVRAMDREKSGGIPHHTVARYRRRKYEPPLRHLKRCTISCPAAHPARFAYRKVERHATRSWDSLEEGSSARGLPRKPAPAAWGPLARDLPLSFDAITARYLPRPRAYHTISQMPIGRFRGIGRSLTTGPRERSILSRPRSFRPCHSSLQSSRVSPPDEIAGHRLRVRFEMPGAPCGLNRRAEPHPAAGRRYRRASEKRSPSEQALLTSDRAAP